MSYAYAQRLIFPIDFVLIINACVHSASDTYLVIMEGSCFGFS